MPYSPINQIGAPQISMFNLPDSTERNQSGQIVQAIDPYWGAGEFIYVKANGSIRQFGLVVLTQAVSGGKYVWNATEAPNTANLGRMVGVAMVSASSGNFLWVCIGGIVPINSAASVAADTAFGIGAAGQGGAIANGKQILNARVIVAATATVAKTNCSANSGSYKLRVSNSDGWFAGAYLSGTGVGTNAKITDIDPSGTIVTMNVVSTAAITGTVTATYNNSTIYYNVAHINRPFAQGQIV